MRPIALFLVLFLCMGAANYDYPPPKKSVSLSGSQTRAIVVALEAFQKKYESADLSKFDVHLVEGDETYEVIFVPIPPPGEESLRGGGNSNGDEVHYHISKSTLAILRVTFGR